MDVMTEDLGLQEVQDLMRLVCTSKLHASGHSYTSRHNYASGHTYTFASTPLTVLQNCLYFILYGGWTGLVFLGEGANDLQIPLASWILVRFYSLPCLFDGFQACDHVSALSHHCIM